MITTIKLNKLLTAGIFSLALISCNNSGNYPQQGGTAPVVQEQTAPVAAQQVDSTQMAQTAGPAQTVQALPAPVTQFIQQHFPGAAIALVETDTDMGGLEYDVTLNDGTEVDFDPNNQWEKVDCHVKAVPAVLVPNAIASYVKSNYQSLPIVKIERKHIGYEIELSNGLDLQFDINGRFIRMDD